MFTLQQIHDAHSSVKSGADFPAYIHALQQLGVVSYTIFVTDGHAVYRGIDEYKLSSGPTYPLLRINSIVDKAKFMQSLQDHQQGNTDYMTFCQDAADAGIAYWCMNLQTMECLYGDANNATILIESIPQL